MLIVDLVNKAIQQMDFSGNRFAYSESTGILAISNVDVSGSSSTAFYDIEAGDWIRSPIPNFLGVAWSPDGKLLLGSMSRDLEYWASVLEPANVDSEPEVVLKGMNRRRYIPLGWSPRANLLAIEKATTNGIKVQIVSWPDREVDKLHDFVGCQVSPDWSPTTDAIAYMGNPNRNWDIIIEIPGSVVARNITNSAAIDEYHPRWSPSGDRIVYVGEEAVEYAETTTQDIYIADVASGKIRKLTDTEFQDEAFPTWSPDGKTIAYLSQIGDDLFLGTIDATSGIQTRIIALPHESPSKSKNE
jgi:WD40 repeat protein